MDSFFFVYRNAKGELSGRELTNISETENHLQGICLTAGELRTFRKDRVIEYVTNAGDLAERLAYHVVNTPPSREPVTKPRPAPGQMEVCFTGFKINDKDRLIQLAKDTGFFVRDSVTKDLFCLCYGYNAGPKKLEKARFQGVVIVSEKQFLDLVENGEIPDDV